MGSDFAPRSIPESEMDSLYYVALTLEISECLTK